MLVLATIRYVNFSLKKNSPKLCKKETERVGKHASKMHFLKLQHDLNLSRYHAKIKWTDSLQNFPQEAWNATTTKTHAIIESLKIRSRPSRRAKGGLISESLISESF